MAEALAESLRLSMASNMSFGSLDPSGATLKQTGIGLQSRFSYNVMCRSSLHVHIHSYSSINIALLHMVHPFLLCSITALYIC